MFTYRVWNVWIGVNSVISLVHWHALGVYAVVDVLWLLVAVGEHSLSLAVSSQRCKP